MTEVTLHATPRGRDVVVEQIRGVGLGLGREALALAVVFVIMTVLIGIDIAHGSAASWFDSDDWSPMAYFGFLLPFAIWRREKRFGPAFLWTLPVDRRRLALAKVFAGWVWLMAALTVFILWQLALAAVSGVANPQIVSVFSFTGATAMYLFGSAVMLGLRHPLYWVFGTLGVVYVLSALGPYGIDAILSSRAFCSVVKDATDPWQTLPFPAQWAILTFLWIGAGLAVLWPAVSRHRELRRR